MRDIPERHAGQIGRVLISMSGALAFSVLEGSHWWALPIAFAVIYAFLWVVYPPGDRDSES